MRTVRRNVLWFGGVRGQFRVQKKFSAVTVRKCRSSHQSFSLLSFIRSRASPRITPRVPLCFRGSAYRERRSTRTSTLRVRRTHRFRLRRAPDLLLPSTTWPSHGCARPLVAVRLFIEQLVTRTAFTRSCGGLTVKDGSPTWRRAMGGARACRRLETGVARGGRARQRRCVTSRSCARCSRSGNPLR